MLHFKKEKGSASMLSDNIRKYRKLNHMSQDELAEKLGVTRQSISLWETGQTQPSLDNIVALAKLFLVSTDKLLTEDEPTSVCDGAVKPSKGNASKKKMNTLIIIVCFILVAVLLISILLWKNGIFTTKNNVVADSSTNESINSSTTESTSSSTTESTSSSTSESTNSVPVGGNQSVVPENTQGILETPNTNTTKDIYGYLKNFVIQNGTINGDYCYYSKTADNYGGYSSEDFSLYYWGDTEKIEFCLHSVLDNTFSINFYLYVPKNHTGNYEYISSYYYRENGEPLYEAKGTIVAGEFTNNYPLNCTRYIGSTDKQNEFMEMSRQGICDLIDCLEEFIIVEKIEYSFSDFGFTKF